MTQYETQRRSGAGRVHSPAREDILDFVQAHPHGVSLAQITEHTKKHENTVRAHLEALVTDGYLVRQPAARVGRGRPAWIFTPVENEHQAMSNLAQALAGQIAHSSADPVQAGIEAGHRWGAALRTTADDAAEARVRVNNSLARLGFAPQTQDAQRTLLTSCPLLSAAQNFPQIVCNVHLGMVQAMLEDPHREADHEVELLPFAEPNGCALIIRDATERQR